jgi:hypothetical protein
MNVIDCWPEKLAPVLMENTESAWLRLFEQRRITYRGFASLEEHQGFLKIEQSLASAKGQEMVRILFARGIEEMLESRDSQDQFHFQEEMIDSLNYLMAIPLLDPYYNTVAADLAQACCAGFDSSMMNVLRFMKWEQVYSNYDQAGTQALLAILDSANLMLEKLRNRAWQNSPQSTYFDGWPTVIQFLSTVIRAIGKTAFWGDWTKFVEFFMAKDAVLQFRIRSKY